MRYVVSHDDTSYGGIADLRTAMAVVAHIRAEIAEAGGSDAHTQCITMSVWRPTEHGGEVLVDAATFPLEATRV